ncbi:Non-specific lipid-transfer protein [Daphnia magna]|uniref:Sterol carrier protein 2 n=1 Tax=Daphnia magna TaxID=35525 RepID=A0A0P5BBM6_9CRUS|nr:Non-specific lipid-transfer protein [Daphnia magna]
MANNMLRKVYVIGVGMTKFEKPGRRSDFDYPDMVAEAVTNALNDGKVAYQQVQQAVVGYVDGESCCGQRALYPLGMSGIPIYNVNNNCSTGSSALLLAQQLVAGGVADCVLAVGFEKMKRGSLTGKGYDDRVNPMDRHVGALAENVGIEPAPIAAQWFGAAGLEHMKKYGTKEVHMAKIAYKNHKHSVNNPKSQFRDEYTLEQILASPPVYGPLTKLQCCPTSDGSAAAILVSEAFAIKHGLLNRAVEILGMEMATDLSSTFGENSSMKLVGYDMTKVAAQKLFAKTGLKPSDVQVVELHDCFSANELITYEALGLCPEGKAGEMIDRGDNTYGGKYVVNPSGGLISKGHPLGATGLAQCAELTWQLRGEADKRQVPDCKLALQHNIGLGGAVVVALYKMAVEKQASGSVRIEGFKSSDVFELMQNALAESGAELTKKVGGVFLFKVAGEGGKQGSWVVDAKNNGGSVRIAKDGDKGDVTISMKDDDLTQMLAGKLAAQQAYFQGRLKVQGNMGLAMKLQELTKNAQPLKAKL